jgi:cytosine/adenosine deaminase-related metal-dependent hydrolase
MSAPVDIIVRNARLRGQNGPVDIAITKDRIGSVQAAIAAKARREIDAAGSLVLPGLFNLHLHSDKSLLGEVMRPNVSGTLPEAIQITNEFKRNYHPAEVAGRAVRVLEAGVKNGTYGIAPGKRADLAIVGAPSVHEAIRLQPLRRHVIKGGREVARSVVTQELLKD